MLRLATARTGADGTYSVVVKPTVPGTLAVGLAASRSYQAVTTTVGTVTVGTPGSTLAASVDRSTVAYGSPIAVTGSLSRVAQATGPASAQTVRILVQVSGRTTPTTVGSVRTLADGSFRVALPMRHSGRLSAVYAGSRALVAAAQDLGELDVRP